MLQQKKKKLQTQTSVKQIKLKCIHLTLISIEKICKGNMKKDT